MTPRERVLTAFDHVEPDRVPMWCGASPEFWNKAKAHLGIQDDEALRQRFHDDFRRVWPRYVGPEVKLGPGAKYQTPFGIDRHGVGFGQPMSHPLADANLDQVHAYPWPEPGWMDPGNIRADASPYHGRYAILGGDWSPFFHDMIDMLGMENAFLKMYDAPEIVDAILEHIVDYYLDVSRRIFEAAADVIDIFFIGNDFGSQTGPLLGEDLFRRFMMPHLSRMIDLGHEHDLKVMLHCCGGYAPLIPALIEAGLDGVHAVQPCCRGMDLRQLKADFGDKLLFNGAIDSHHVLIDGTPDEVRRRTRAVLEIMMPGGGYVAGASHDFILEETPVENVVAMFDTVAEYGRYH